MEGAGKVEAAESQEAYLRWQADRVDDDARLTGLLMETEAVEADRQPSGRRGGRSRCA